MRQEKITQGASFGGMSSTIGFILLIIGVVVLIYGINSPIAIETVFLGILISLVGIILFISIRGVLINYKENKIKVYLDILVTKIGFWRSLDEFNKVVLKFVNESQAMNYKSVSTTVRTISFDVVLANHGNNELLLRSFSNYDDAKKFLVEYSVRLNKAMFDRYAEIREELSIRRHISRR